MIVNAFTFNGQYEMLNIHLTYMYPYVDQFFITEGNRTFSGEKKQKESYFKDSPDFVELDKFKDKIVYDLYDAQALMKKMRLSPKRFLRYRDITSWHVQNHTKNNWIKRARKLYEQNPNQQIIFIVSDLDQFLNMAIWKEITTLLTEHDIIAFDGCPFFFGYFNNLLRLKQGIFLKVANVSRLISMDKLNYTDWLYRHNLHLHSKGVIQSLPTVVSGKGKAWHFTSVMSEIDFKRKQSNLSHIIDYQVEYGSLQNSLEHINWTDQGKIVDLKKFNVPKQLLNSIEKYPYLLRGRV